jgi:hypothetical protein
VDARLTVTDEAAAERALAEALERAGGTVVARRADGAAVVLEVSVPGVRYEAFVEALARLGRLEIARAPEAPAALPQVRIRILR